MIAVRAEHDHLQVTIPTAGMTPDEVNDLVSWLRVECVVRRRRFAPKAGRPKPPSPKIVAALLAEPAVGNQSPEEVRQIVEQALREVRSE
jgi:hypothetical protein